MTSLPQTMTLFSIAFISLGMSVLILAQNRRSVVNRSFALFLLGLSVTITGFVFLLEERPFLLYDRLIHYGGLILLFGLLLFSRTFPSRKCLPPRMWPLFIPFVAVALIIPFNLIIRRSSFDTLGQVVPVNGPLFVPYIVFWAAYVILSIFFLARTYREVRGKERLQMHYLFAGIVLLLASFLLFNLLLPLFGVSSLFFMSAVAAIIMILLASYAIVRHELLDIRIVIQRGLIYTILIAIILGAYSAGVELLGDLIHNLTETSIVIWGGIATVIGAALIGPLERYFRKITDAIFFKDAYDYADALHLLSRILETSLDRNNIVGQSAENLRMIFKTGQAEFVFDPSPEDAARTNAAGFATLSQPLMFEGTAIGIIKLGKKRSGDSYTKRDQKLLSTFAIHAAVAIAKADLYAKVEGHNAHLEAVVDERTREIKKMQEDQKQTMIDISHNLQTPLAIIRGELEMLGESGKDEIKVAGAKDSLDRVSGFIRQLLHLARLEHSLYDVDLRELDLSELVREQADYFEVMAAESGVRIETSIEDGCHVLGNKRLLHELFINLVTNAMTYRSPKRAPVIRIALACRDDRVEVSVADNGIGISEKDLPEIFTRFYRIPQPDAEKPKEGTGLGLAIVKNIVERHGGTIRVESVVDAGTTFFFTLPCE